MKITFGWFSGAIISLKKQNRESNGRTDETLHMKLAYKINKKLKIQKTTYVKVYIKLINHLYFGSFNFAGSSDAFFDTFSYVGIIQKLLVLTYWDPGCEMM